MNNDKYNGRRMNFIEFKKKIKIKASKIFNIY